MYPNIFSEPTHLAQRMTQRRYPVFISYYDSIYSIELYLHSNPQRTLELQYIRDEGAE